MYIVDTHCDSLLCVNSDTGLINPHNLSARSPQLQLFAEFVPAVGMTPDYRRRQIFHYLDIYISECQRLGIMPVRDCQELNFAVERGVHSSILAIEGGGGLLADSPELDTLYRMGLRVMGLCWDTNELATSAWDENDLGLSEEGKRLVDRLSAYGIIIDVSHLSDKSFYDVIERSSSGKADKSDIFRHVDYCLERLGEDILCFGCDIDGTEGEYPIGFSEERSIHDDLCDILIE